MRRKLAAGNWKMNGTKASLGEIETLMAEHASPSVDVLICPPATLVSALADKAEGHTLAVGAQDCHANEKGAHTGDLGAPMLVDAGASYIITGHSERRADHGESDADVRAKSEAAIGAGAVAVVCIGETLNERESGSTLDVIGGQLEGSVPDNATGANAVIAYEPVWAIGTGKVPTTEQIAEVHAFVRSRLTERFGDEGHAFRILYGGSVKASNADEIFAVADVDGALVGGASLKAADFGPIITALENA